MKTTVDVRIEIGHDKESQLEEAMNEIESNIKAVTGVESVNIGIGEDSD